MLLNNSKHLDFLFSIFNENFEKDAIIWKDQNYTYGWLLERIHFWCQLIESKNILSGTTVALDGDFSPNSIALLLALAEKSCIIMPVLYTLNSIQKKAYYEIAQIDWIFSINEHDEIQTKCIAKTVTHPLYLTLKEQGHPGLIIFSSGTSGKPKAILHNLLHLIRKPETKRPSAKMLNFLLFDHMGGVDTLLKTLSSGWTVVTIQERSPDAICMAIETHQVEILPVSPTFLNLLLLSQIHQNYDLSSLKVIAYGTEPMPESTLFKVKSLFPDVKLFQTYGLSELGVFPVKSKSSDSLWVKIEGDGIEYRIIDGILHTKTPSSMLGYLNEASPFTEDGWFNTGDAVEMDGEYLKILGRKSEIINVGGEKVYPIEIESIIQEMNNVGSVTVYGEKNPIMGNVLCTKVHLLCPESNKEFLKRLKLYCKDKLQPYKIPVRVIFSEESLQYSERFKKARQHQ